MAILSKSKLALGGLVLASGLMVGCAGTPPTEQINISELSVNAAVSADATKHAPTDMQSAQANLRQSKIAMDEKNYVLARKLAEKAEWDARVAERRSQAQRLKLINPSAVIQVKD